MPNANEHRVKAGIAVGLAVAALDQDDDQNMLPSALIASGIAYATGTLPDIIEPATNPNHRQFFHSWPVFGLVGYGIYKNWQWEPKTKLQNTLKIIGYGIGGAYAVHLMMDSRTPKGLPII